MGVTLLPPKILFLMQYYKNMVKSKNYIFFKKFLLIASILHILSIIHFEICEAAISTMDSSGFVVLTDIVPDAHMEIRYYTLYNFIGDQVRGYEEPVALVTKETALALREVQKEIEPLGYAIKIFDAYRPQMAVNHFVEWAQDIKDKRMQKYFYPEENKANLFTHGYIASRSGHSRGSTIDLTFYDVKNECDLDMGGTFDYFGYRSHPDFPNLTVEQKQNRELLRSIMRKHGFRGIDSEWWHFTLNNEPYPNTYFNFKVKRL